MAYKITSPKRIKQVQWLKEFLEKNPELDRKQVKVALSYNIGWSFHKTEELLKTLEGVEDIKVEMPGEEGIDLEVPDTFGETVNELSE